jgi:hypothetical protein
LPLQAGREVSDTIDRKRFAYWMGVIGDRCNRALSAETYGEYYRTLAESFDTPTFERAARAVFKTSEFWPSPQAFIDAVRPNLALAAADAFESVRQLAHRTGLHPYWVADEISAKTGVPGLIAFRSIGGGERLAYLEAHDLPFARREFVAAYVAAVNAEDKGQPLLNWLETKSAPRLMPGAEGGHAVVVMPNGQVVDSWRQ